MPLFQMLSFVFFLFLFGKCLLDNCRLRNAELQTQEAAFQVKEFGAFLYVGRFKSQGSLKFCPWYVSQLSVILYSQNVLKVHHRQWLESDDY